MAESCRKMFEQTKNRAFKREGGSIYTVSEHTGSLLVMYPEILKILFAFSR